MNPEQLKAALRRAGYLVSSEGGYAAGGGDISESYTPLSYYYYGPRGRTDAREAAAATGISEATLRSMESQLVATPEESSSLYPSRGGGGFFSMLTDFITSPPFMLAASVAAPSILAAGATPAAAGAAGAAGAAPAATGATLGAADLAALDAGLGGLPAVGYPVATPPLATMGGPNILMDFPANMIDSSLGQSYNALGVGAGAAPAATGANALAPVFDPASAMETQLIATGTPAAVAATPTAAAAAPGASNALAGYGGAGDVLDPATGSVISGADAAGLSAGAFDTLAKFAKDYGVPLASLISGGTGSQAAKSAADIQAEAAREARDLAYKVFQEQKALQDPFRTAGVTAQNQLMTLLGLQGGTPGAEFGRYARPFGTSDFQADPGYAFRLSEGLKALEASRAARGGLLSGATGKALSRYGQGLASQEYGNAFTRYQTERANRLAPLGSLMQTGQAAASGMAGNAGMYGATAGGLTTDIGAAQAAGDVGSANAIANALSQYSRYASSQNLANQIRQSAYGPAITIR